MRRRDGKEGRSDVLHVATDRPGIRTKSTCHLLLTTLQKSDISRQECEKRGREVGL
jgi:hypothetical protein